MFIAGIEIFFGLLAGTIILGVALWAIFASYAIVALCFDSLKAFISRIKSAYKLGYSFRDR